MFDFNKTQTRSGILLDLVCKMQCGKEQNLRLES
jgi:hypothetical protein